MRCTVANAGLAALPWAPTFTLAAVLHFHLNIYVPALRSIFQFVFGLGYWEMLHTELNKLKEGLFWQRIVVRVSVGTTRPVANSHHKMLLYLNNSLYISCPQVFLCEHQIQTTATWWRGDVFPVMQAHNVWDCWLLFVVFAICSNAAFWPWRRQSNS